MATYLKKFETQAAYKTAESDLILPNVSLCKDNWNVYYNPIPPKNIIIYEATRKLSETTKNDYTYALHTTVFKDINNQQLTITSHTFKNGVGTIEFDGDIAIIGNNAFYGIDYITGVIIPDDVTTINGSAFCRCENLANVTLGKSVTTIGNTVFANCYALTNINFPKCLTSIGSTAFSSCGNLISINIPNSVTNIGDYAFNLCYLANSNFINNSSLSPIENNYWGAKICDSEINGLLINNNSTIFKCRTNVSSVTIPNNITNIGDSSFSKCEKLTEITIPDNVTSIGAGAFGGCSNINTIIIGSSVTSIGNSVFSGCYNLTNMTVNAINPPTLGTSVFAKYSEEQIVPNIYVPAESVEAYKAASGWSDYASKIQAIS